MKLWRLESPSSDPAVGGILIEYPSGIRKSLIWNDKSGDLTDSLEFAKALAARALDVALREKRIHDAEFTNWASVIAAMQHHVREWQRELTKAKRDAARDLVAGDSVH